MYLFALLTTSTEELPDLKDLQPEDVYKRQLLSCIHRMFCRTANTVNGSISSFEEKCLVLQHCCSRGDLPFSEDEYHSYMNTYREMGYPVLSHSTVYHAAYRPAYRIVYEVYGLSLIHI